MSLYAKVSADGKAVLAIAEKDPATVHAKLDLAPGKPYWLPYTRNDAPTYNPDIEHPPSSSDVISADRVVQTWTVAKLTPAEQQAQLQKTVLSAPPELIYHAVFKLANEIRVLKGEPELSQSDHLAEMMAEAASFKAV